MSLQRLSQFDQRLFLKSQSALQGNANRVWARWLSRSGDGPLYGVFGLFCWLSAQPALQALGQDLLLAFALEIPLYIVLKQACRRQRPAMALPAVQAWVQPADRFSLPSGHTAAAFLVFTLVLLHAGAPGLMLLPWAMGVGASRVVLGVHFPGDVLAGAVLGGLVACLVFTG